MAIFVQRMRLPEGERDEMTDEILDASESTQSVDGIETIIPLEIFSEGQRGFYVNLKLVVLQRKWLLWFSSFDIAIAVHVEIWNFSTENGEDNMRGQMKREDAREFKAAMNQKDTTGISPEETSRWTEYFRNRAFSKFMHNCPKSMLKSMFHSKTNGPDNEGP